MGLPIGVNEKLCVVANVDTFNRLVDCSEYSDEFLFNRLRTFKDIGVPKHSDNPIAELARHLILNKFTDSSVKYIASRRIVFCDDLPLGAFVCGHEPMTLIKHKDDRFKKEGVQ